MSSIPSPITPENVVLSAGQTIADLRQVEEMGEFVYLLGAEANHPDLVIKSRNDDICSVMKELSTMPVKKMRKEFMTVSRLIALCPKTTDRLKEEGGLPWTNFCNDIANYYCYRATLFKRPIPVISQAQYDDLCAKRGVWLDGAKPEGYDAKSRLTMLFKLINDKGFLAHVVSATTINEADKQTMIECAKQIAEDYPEGITMEELEDIIKGQEEDDDRLPRCGDCGKKPSQAKEILYLDGSSTDWICEVCNEPHRIARLKREADMD
jgi:hypothetical protein